MFKRLVSKGEFLYVTPSWCLLLRAALAPTAEQRQAPAAAVAVEQRGDSGARHQGGDDGLRETEGPASPPKKTGKNHKPNKRAKPAFESPEFTSDPF